MDYNAERVEVSTWANVSGESVRGFEVPTVDFIVAPGAFQINISDNPFPQTVGHMTNESARMPLWSEPPECGTWYCKGYGAARCTLRPCVRTYEANITTGIFQETLVEQSPLDAFARSSHNPGTLKVLATVDTHCLSQDEKSNLSDINHTLDPNQRWMPINITFDLSLMDNSTFPSSVVEHKCLYAIATDFTDSLWTKYLQYFFNGTISAQFPIPGVSKYEGPQNLQAIFNNGEVTFESLNSTFANISEALTTYIRQGGEKDHSDPATGMVLHSQTCLEVRWGKSPSRPSQIPRNFSNNHVHETNTEVSAAWLALPTTLVLLTLTFFISMMIQTRRTQIWKSSPLALPCHGLEAHDKLQDSVLVGHICEMEDLANNVSVKLDDTIEGVKLVRRVK